VLGRRTRLPPEKRPKGRYEVGNGESPVEKRPLGPQDVICGVVA